MADLRIQIEPLNGTRNSRTEAVIEYRYRVVDVESGSPVVAVDWQGPFTVPVRASSVVQLRKRLYAHAWQKEQERRKAAKPPPPAIPSVVLEKFEESIPAEPQEEPDPFDEGRPNALRHLNRE